MIVIGYQGIGKSTLVKERNSYIDYKLCDLFDNLLKDEKVLKTFGFKRLQVQS